MDQTDARKRMEGCLAATIAQAGFLAGLDTVKDCMQDEALRAFLGHALLDEIMPVMDMERSEVSRLAMDICREWEAPAIEITLLSLAFNGARAWERQTLPVMEEYLRLRGEIPPCLAFGLSCLIMYFSGVKRNPDGIFEGIRGGNAYIPQEDEDVLSAFARLSPDMPPETLAYAVLSDRDIWEGDLREVDGLAEMIEGQIRDLQILGLMDAMKKCYGK